MRQGMIKKALLAIIMVLGLSCYGSPVIDPTTVFVDYPWSQYTNQPYFNIETNCLMHKQIFYSLSDRARVANHWDRPWTEKQYTLGCGFPTVALQRTTNSYLNTNTVQLLLGPITRTNTVTAWAYWYCHPQDDTNVTNATATATADMALYKELYDTLDLICTNYAPASLGNNVTDWLTNNPTYLPGYSSVGALAYDAGYSSIVSNIVWSNGTIYSCDWNFGTNYSLPNTGSVHTVATTILKLPALDCMAAMIAQLKWLRADAIRCGVEGISGWGYYQWAELYNGKTLGWDGGTRNSKQIAAGDYTSDYYGSGNLKSPLAWAFMAQVEDDDFAWAEADLTQKTDTNYTDSWSALTSFPVYVVNTNSTKSKGWATSGFYGNLGFDITLDVDITAGQTNLPSSGYYWRFVYDSTTFDDWGDARTFTTNYSSTYNGFSPINWTETWKSYGQLFSSSNYIEEVTNFNPVLTPFTIWSNSYNYVNSGTYNYYAWTNQPSGLTYTDLITHCYFGTTKWEFTNTFTTTADFTNQYWKTNNWCYTNRWYGQEYTNFVSTPATNIIPGYWNFNWDQTFETITSDGSWTFATNGTCVNGVVSKGLYYNIRPDLNYVLGVEDYTTIPPEPKLEMDKTRWFFMGLPFHNGVSDSVLDLPEWTSVGLEFEVPETGYGDKLNWWIQYVDQTNSLIDTGDGISPWHDTYGANNMLWVPLGYSDNTVYFPWVPFENKAKNSIPRYWWGIDRGYWMLEYTFTERKTSLPK